MYSEKTVADHIKPLYGFGDNDFQNLVISCWDCNKKKGKESGWKKPDWIKDNKYASKNYDQPSVKIDSPNPYIESRNIWNTKSVKEEASPAEAKQETLKDKIEDFLMDLHVYSVGDFFALIFLLLFVVFPIILLALAFLYWLVEMGR